MAASTGAPTFTPWRSSHSRRWPVHPPFSRAAPLRWRGPSGSAHRRTSSSATGRPAGQGGRVARAAGRRAAPGVAPVGGGGDLGGGRGRGVAHRHRRARQLRAPARRAEPSRGDAVRRPGHRTISRITAAGILHLTIPAGGTAERSRLVRSGRRAARQRGPLQRGSPRARLPPRRAVLRARKRGVCRTGGHAERHPL